MSQTTSYKANKLSCAFVNLTMILSVSVDVNSTFKIPTLVCVHSK